MPIRPIRRRRTPITRRTPLIRERRHFPALLQTLRHARGDVGGQVVPEVFDALAVERQDAEVGLHEVWAQFEEGLRGLLDAGVFACEARDEDCWVAVGVELGVWGLGWLVDVAVGGEEGGVGWRVGLTGRSLGEDCHLPGGKSAR